MTNLRKLAEEQKNQRALKIKNRFLRQTRNINLAGSLSPITEKIDEVNISIKKMGGFIEESNSENKNNQEIVLVDIDSDNSEGDNLEAFPKSSIFSDLMAKSL